MKYYKEVDRGKRNHFIWYYKVDTKVNLYLMSYADLIIPDNTYLPIFDVISKVQFKHYAIENKLTKLSEDEWIFEML